MPPKGTHHFLSCSFLPLQPSILIVILSFSKMFLFIFREKRKRETSIGCLQYPPHLRTKPANRGTCPNQESNWRPFSLWDDAQLSEPHWLELLSSYIRILCLLPHFIKSYDSHFIDRRWRLRESTKVIYKKKSTVSEI